MFDPICSYKLKQSIALQPSLISTVLLLRLLLPYQIVALAAAPPENRQPHLDKCSKLAYVLCNEAVIELPCRSVRRVSSPLTLQSGREGKERQAVSDQKAGRTWLRKLDDVTHLHLLRWQCPTCGYLMEHLVRLNAITTKACHSCNTEFQITGEKVFVVEPFP